MIQVVLGGFQICGRTYKRERLSILYLQRQNNSKPLIESNMKFPVALLSAVFSTIFVQATAISRPGTGMINTTCTPGDYICYQDGNFGCDYYPSIVRISTHNSRFLVIRTNRMLQIVCDGLGRSYHAVACCGARGCEVIDGAPHCM